MMEALLLFLIGLFESSKLCRGGQACVKCKPKPPRAQLPRSPSACSKDSPCIARTIP